jgi:hypothetical protein
MKKVVCIAELDAGQLNAAKYFHADIPVVGEIYTVIKVIEGGFFKAYVIKELNSGACDGYVTDLFRDIDEAFGESVLEKITQGIQEEELVITL